MFRLLVAVYVLSALSVLETNTARILCVFPTPSFSHHRVHRALTEALARRGHHVVVITTHPFPPGTSPANVTEIDTYNISHALWEHGINQVFHKKSDDITIGNLFFDMFMNIFEKQIRYEQVQDLLKSGRDRFDLLLLESNVVPTLGLLNVFDAPAVQISTFGPMPITYPSFGAPSQPLLYPTAVSMRLYNLTLWETINNLYKFVAYNYVLRNHERKDNEMLQANLGLDKSDILPISKLYEKVHLYLQTVYPIWMNNPPVPPGIVYLGGLHQKPSNSLPQELQKILDASQNGVIYVSFGSNVHPSLLCEEKINMMASAFSKLPYDVLWKKDQHMQINGSRNVHVSTWYPQSDLLYHPKIKLFLSHGGLQSSEEAITAGVPLIGIPMFGDQWMNTENYVHLGIGLQLDWETLSELQLIRAIENVIADKSYKEKVVRLARIMADQPLTPAERAIWWTEYVLRHGGARHLLPQSANMSWTQYFEVELIIEVLVGILIVFSIFTYTVVRLARCIRRRTMYKKFSKII